MTFTESAGEFPHPAAGRRKEVLRFPISVAKTIQFGILFFTFSAAAGYLASGVAFPLLFRAGAALVSLACAYGLLRFLGGSLAGRYSLTIDETGIRQKQPLGEFFVPWEAARSATSFVRPLAPGGNGQPVVQIRLAPDASRKCVATLGGDRLALADKEDPHLDIIGDLWGISPARIAELINERLESR